MHDDEPRPPDRRLLAAAEGELRVQGSKFVARVEPVSGDAARAELLERMQAAYSDASHHCWGWRGHDGEERSSDAGEPSGTAGRPIVGALAAARLVDTMAVVVRWFGGTKLGRGGLVRAYAGAVRQALAGAKIEESWPTRTLEIDASYAQYGALEGAVRAWRAELEAMEFAARVQARLRVDERDLEAVREKLSALAVMVREVEREA